MVVVKALRRALSWSRWRFSSQEKLHQSERMLYQMAGLDPESYRMTKIARLGTVHVPYTGSNPNPPTLVLWHGFAAGNAFWAMNLKHLSKNFHVVRIF